MILPRWVRVAGAVVGVLALGAVAFWAGRVTLTPAERESQVPDSFVDVTVVEQQVGRVLTLTTTVRRSSAPLAANALAGVVTSVTEDGTHAAGDVLYMVGDTPVTLVAGTVPFWRDLGFGAAGEDVRQVQRFLADAGYPVQVVDGEWGSRTTSAVKAWQKSIGASQTGGLTLGTLVAAPTLPVTIDLDTAVLRPGAVLQGGEEAVLIPGGEPVFVMELTSSQAAMVPDGTSVVVHADGADWSGVTGEPRVTDDGVEVPVTAPDGGLLCGSDCDRLSLADETYLLTDVAIRPPVTGPVVPVAALTTGPDGVTTVDVVGDGGRIDAAPVEIVAVADGLAVVTGVEAGQRVRVFGEGAGGAAAPTSADP